MKKLTIEYVKNYIEEKHPGAKCLSFEYKNAHIKLDMKCEKGHEFKIDYKHLKEGVWCAKCNYEKKKYTAEYVREYINNKHLGAFCKIIKYEGATKKFDVICENGHKFNTNFSRIQQGQWCSQCAGIKPLTIDQVKEFIEKLHPGSICNFYEYKNVSTKLDIICENGHEFKIRFNHLKRGHWCPECGGTKKLNIEHVKEFIKEKHPGSKCLSVDYNGNKSKLKFICENKHEFNSSFNGIQQGTWCPKCCGNERHTIEYVKDFIHKLHPGTVCDFAEYENVSSKINLICENGHKFATTFNIVQRKFWCPFCSDKTYKIEYVKEFIENLHPGCVCKSTTYKNIFTKLDLICKNKHNFRANFSNIRAGTWCPYCQELKSEKYVRTIFEKFTGKLFVKTRPSWLINPKTNYRLELDGFNEELKIAFECQGVQHYEYCKRFQKTEDKFKQQQYKDNLKKELCIKNNIKLICIPAIGVKIDGKIYKKKDIEIFIKTFLINECKIMEK